MTKPILTSLYVEYPGAGGNAAHHLQTQKTNGRLNSHRNAPSERYKVQSTYIRLVQKSVSQRQTIEQFIQQQYKQHFDAEIHHFFPVLISVYRSSNDALIGTVGIRYADHDDLFSEQYLTQPVEQLLKAQTGETIERSSVIELGHFALAHRRFLVPVVRAIAQFIGQLQVDWTVYTLSQPMVKAVNRLNIPTQFLGFACAEQLRDQDNQWGQYYRLKPAVYCSHTTTAIEAIQHGRSKNVAH
ncbi:MAG: thermostable hemolysin [Proteobacteria bacterium]|nr:thermostable hemolysin [Pseudomonadota bacterium]